MIRIMLVDDHALLREGLRKILEEAPDMEVVGEATEGREAIDLALLLNPDIVVMDISMPNMDGFDATKRLHSLRPQIGIVILTMHVEPHFAKRLLRAGALGYTSKGAAATELVNAIRAANDGEHFVTADLGVSFLDDWINDDITLHSLDALTDRELQVLQQLASGSTNREIAITLGVSVKTVNTHRANVLSKLGLRNNADLTRFALEHKLLETN